MCSEEGGREEGRGKGGQEGSEKEKGARMRRERLTDEEAEANG